MGGPPGPRAPPPEEVGSAPSSHPGGASPDLPSTEQGALCLWWAGGPPQQGLLQGFHGLLDGRRTQRPASVHRSRAVVMRSTSSYLKRASFHSRPWPTWDQDGAELGTDGRGESSAPPWLPRPGPQMVPTLPVPQAVPKSSTSLPVLDLSQQMVGASADVSGTVCPVALSPTPLLSASSAPLPREGRNWASGSRPRPAPAVAGVAQVVDARRLPTCPDAACAGLGSSCLSWAGTLPVPGRRLHRPSLTPPSFPPSQVTLKGSCRPTWGCRKPGHTPWPLPSSATGWTPSTSATWCPGVAGRCIPTPARCTPWPCRARCSLWPGRRRRARAARPPARPPPAPQAPAPCVLGWPLRLAHLRPTLSGCCSCGPVGVHGGPPEGRRPQPRHSSVPGRWTVKVAWRSRPAPPGQW